MSAQLGLGIAALPPGAIDTFESWWLSYPRKIDKVEARKAYVRARRKASAEELVIGLLRYRFADEKRLIPHPATWLHKERWLVDEPDPALDPWGLGEFYAAQPVDAPGLFSVRGYEFEALVEVLQAAGFEPKWRGDLSTLGEWLVAGFRPDSIAETIAEDAKRSAARFLRWFDRGVRRRALRWDALSGDWLRGW